MPIMDPLHNVREVAKQLLLLEDHLFHGERHCPDCITKHLLTAEAFAEEARSLDMKHEHRELLTVLPGQVRDLFRLYQEGHGPLDIAQAARKLRKGLMPTTLQVRVASDRLGAGDAADITRNLPAFMSAYEDLARVVKDGVDRNWSGTHMAVRRLANAPWVQLMERGYKIAEGILSTRSVPPRQAKSLEMAYRLFSNSRSMPKDVYKWFATNSKRLAFIMDAAAKWPEKVEGGDELFVVGSFRVHNTIKATGPELESLKTAIAAVEKAARTNPVPGFSSAVYGDVYVVGQLTKSHHAAWYKPGDDSLYLRRTKRTGLDEVRAMIHELGHRWYAKRAGKAEQKLWNSHHIRLSVQAPVNFQPPQVGDEIPVRVKGMTGHPVIESISEGLYRYRVPGGRLSGISERKVRLFLYEQAQREQSYPTGYSSTSPEEHFCEALSLKALGKLPAQHLEEFDRIWVRGEEVETSLAASRLAARVASRFLERL